MNIHIHLQQLLCWRENRATRVLTHNSHNQISDLGADNTSDSPGQNHHQNPLGSRETPQQSQQVKSSGDIAVVLTLQLWMDRPLLRGGAGAAHDAHDAHDVHGTVQGQSLHLVNPQKL